MDDIPAVYELETVEQLRVIADSLRIRIFDELARQPMTVTQVADALNLPAPRVHYHVREMERLGLVRLVETRERGGILEKYYRSVALSLRAPARLFQEFPANEVTSAMSEFFSTLSREFLAATTRASATGDGSFEGFALALGSDRLWLTPDELKDLVQRIEALLKPFETTRGNPEEREVSLTMVGYDVALAGVPEVTETGTGGSQQPAAEESATPTPRIRPVVVVGMVTYNRADLERFIANGEWLDLNVVGYLSFARDVTPDLVKRAIHTVRYQGLISASAEVREALRGKEVKEG